jgi:hypothetical protein
MLNAEMRNVFSMVVEDITDKIKQQNLGTFASTILTHDLTTKTYTNFQFDYDTKYFNVGSHVETNPLLPFQKTDYSKSPLSTLKFYPNNTYTMDGLVRIADPEETVLYRQSLLTQMDSINVILECHGDTNVKVGQVINFDTFGKESTKQNDKYEDDYLKGRYLITAIRHVVTDRNHRMTMTISRDSFSEPVSDYKQASLA